MRFFILLSLTIFIFTAAFPGRIFAEPYIHEFATEGIWNAGISTGFLVPLENDYYHVTVEPILDYFPADGFHLGIAPVFTIANHGTFNEFTFCLGPRARIGYALLIAGASFFDITPFCGYNFLGYNFTTHGNCGSMDIGADVSFKYDNTGTVYSFTVTGMVRMYTDNTTSGNDYFIMIGMGISGCY